MARGYRRRLINSTRNGFETTCSHLQCGNTPAEEDFLATQRKNLSDLARVFDDVL